MTDTQDAEVDEAPAPDGTELSTIKAIGVRLLDARKQVEDAAVKFKVLQANLKAIEEGELPTAMLSIGLRLFMLDTGHSIEVITSHHASITAERQAAAFAWLRDNGYGDIIKHEIGMTFGQGEEQHAEQALQALREIAPENKYTDKANVHASTLKAFVNNQIANGSPIPFDTFGIYTRTYAEVTDPGAKKRRKASNTEEDF